MILGGHLTMTFYYQLFDEAAILKGAQTAFDTKVDFAENCAFTQCR